MINVKPVYELMWQGGGTPLQSVLRAATAVKVLTKKFIMALHIFYNCAEILLDLDQLDRVYQRDIMA